LLTNPSAKPTVYKALLTRLAKKNKVPIDPPNSGPNVLLIITISKLRNSFIVIEIEESANANVSKKDTIGTATFNFTISGNSTNRGNGKEDDCVCD